MNTFITAHIAYFTTLGLVVAGLIAGLCLIALLVGLWVFMWSAYGPMFNFGRFKTWGELTFKAW